MRANAIEKKAVHTAQTIWKEFLSGGIGVVGGTVKKARGSVIRTSDRCLISRKGDCHLYRHPTLPPNSLTEYCIGYQPQKEEIEGILKDVVYCSGLAVANPIVRFLMYQIDLENLNKASLKEIARKPRWPAINTIEPARYHSGMYSVPLEEFRIREKRPNWCLKLVKSNFPYFAPSKDGFYQQVSEERIKKYMKYWISNAHGVEWITDYAILAKVPNPADPDRSIVICGGNHWLGTLGANALISLTREIPGKKMVFRNVTNSIAWLGEVLEREKIGNFQAILRITDDFLPGGKREISVSCQGIFALPRNFSE